jgi:ABC-type proline/glycine betaine transport system permease subunit
LGIGVLAVVAFPEALVGVQSRFEPEETKGRLILNLMVIPPVALLALDYPMAGIGTGMQQNAKLSSRPM